MDRSPAYVVRRAGELGRPGIRVGPDEKEAWLAAHPPGFLERQEAFGPDGVYGRWLREKSAVRVVQKTAFVHGGVSAAYAKTPPAELDRLVQADLALFDAERREFVEDGLILPFFNFVETTRAVREQLDALGASGKPSERRSSYEKFLDFGRWTMNSEDGPLWFRGYDRLVRCRRRRADAAASVGGRRRALRGRPHRAARRAGFGRASTAGSS